MDDSTTKNFEVVSDGRDHYPGDGLFLRDPNSLASKRYDKEFLDHMNVILQEGDVIEITVRIVARVEPAKLVYR